MAACRTSDSLGNESMLSFDTDLSFWVCDNAATSHICHEKSLFYGYFVPSIYKVSSTAYEIDSTSLIGTVILQLRDNDGIMHEFALTHINYMHLSLLWTFYLFGGELRTIAILMGFLIKMAQESTRVMTVIHFTGTRNSYQGHFALQILVFQYVFSPQNTVIYLHSLHIYPNTLTTQFTGLFLWKSRTWS